MAEFCNTTYFETMLECHRKINKEERQTSRDDVINKRRGILGDVSDSHEKILKPEQVVTIANRIKHKGKVNEEDLKILCFAFIQGEGNINAFLNVAGTLHAIVRELTGVNSLTQWAAAECLINLSLGNSKHCFKIAKSSGPYLITHLQGLNRNLQSTSLWALGNLLGSDIKTWNLLNSQSVLSWILNLLPIPELQMNALYALVHYIRVGFNEITSADFNRIALSVLELKSNTPEIMYVIYLLSCSSCCDNIVSKVIIVSVDVLAKSDEYPIKTVTAVIRILANLVCEETGQNAEIILHDFDKIYAIFDKFVILYSNYKHIIRELIWFFGNLLNHPSFAVQQKVGLISDKINSLENMFSSVIK